MSPHLPLEVQFHILEFSDWWEQPILSRVCKSWRAFIAISPAVFLNRYLTEREASATPGPGYVHLDPLINYHKAIGCRNGFIRSLDPPYTRVPCVIYVDEQEQITGSSQEPEDLNFFNKDPIYLPPNLQRRGDTTHMQRITINARTVINLQKAPWLHQEHMIGKISAGQVIDRSYDVKTLGEFLWGCANTVERLTIDRRYFDIYRYFRVETTVRFGYELTMWLRGEDPVPRVELPIKSIPVLRVRYVRCDDTGLGGCELAVHRGVTISCDGR